MFRISLQHLLAKSQLLCQINLEIISHSTSNNIRINNRTFNSNILCTIQIFSTCIINTEQFYSI